MERDKNYIKGGIWYDPDKPGDKERARKQLSDIEKRYAEKSIGYIGYSEYSNTTEILFDNGDLWQVIPADRRSCGCRFHISYISKDLIDKNSINIITNSTTNSPYAGYNFF